MSAKQSFTPGPWIHGVLGTSVADTEVCYVRSASSDVQDAMAGEPDICLCQSEANAQLISLAPNLLEALEALLMLASVNEVAASVTQERYRALVAKAKGAQ